MKKIFITTSVLIIFLLNTNIAIPQNSGCSSLFDIVKDSSISSSWYAYLFVDRSTGNNIVSWSWDFGDNQPLSNEQFPLHIYEKPGKYNVCLTIKTKKNGVFDCESKSCQTLYVEPQPVFCSASFYYYNYNNNSDSTVTSYPPASGNTFYFINNSSGNISDVVWDFGDGSRSVNKNTVHTFSPGTYNVCLTINGFTSDSIACQDTYCQTITIIQPNLCYADFFSFPDFNHPDTYNFSDASTGHPNKWFWNFGDNTPLSNDKNPVHTFSKPGNYHVCLTIKDDSIDCKDMRCYDVFVGIPQNFCAAAFYYFLDSTKYSMQFADRSKGNPTHFLWNFGDGKVSTDRNPNHVFDKPGIYNVCLLISDSLASGCSDQYCETIFVPEKPSTCKASFTSYLDDSVNTPNVYKFTDKSSGNPDKWHWDFGDGTIDSIQNPQHQYKQFGVFYPCLTITNKSTGCKDVYCSKLFIGGGAYGCHAEFSYETDPSVVSMPEAKVYYFEDISSGNIGTWFWDFGDGTTSAEQNPMHIFYPGTYKVCLTISSNPDQNSICNDTYCSIVFVDSANIPPAPKCNNFIIHVNDVSDSLSVHFFGNSYYSQAPVVYKWNFGDNSANVTAQNTTHKYQSAGTYNVSLTTTDANGCIFTSFQSIFIGEQPANGYVSGQVYAGAHNIDKAIIIIASFDYNANAFSYFDTTFVDAYGGYRFDKLPYGNYYILAVPLKESKYASQYLPTFYGDKWDWADAQTVSVGDIMPTVQFDIHLLHYKNFTSGPGIIQGYVSYGGVKPDKKNPYLSGVEVLLFNIDDLPLDYTYTDSKGFFQFQNLAYGTYKIYVEILGVYSAAALVTITEENEIIYNIGFNVDSNTLPFSINISTNDIINNTFAKVSEIYPNPVSGMANISFNLKKSTEVNIYVYDQIGRNLMNLSKSLGSGFNTIQIDASRLSSGIYNVMISSHDGIHKVKKFVKY